MKKLVLNLAVFLLALPAFAQGLPLQGNDALRLEQILAASGIKATPVVGGSRLRAFDLICLVGGRFPTPFCMVSRTPVDPAVSRVDILPRFNAQVWDLSVRAGIKPFVSEVSDGTAGDTVLVADSIDCVAIPAHRQFTCTLTVQ